MSSSQRPQGETRKVERVLSPWWGEGDGGVLEGRGVVERREKERERWGEMKEKNEKIDKKKWLRTNLNKSNPRECLCHRVLHMSH